MTTLRTVGEIGFGVLFAAGATFMGAYTLSHADEFYGSFADGAWLSPAQRGIERLVIPNATLVTVLVIVYEAVVAVMILSRGSLVMSGLLAGALFAFVAAAASNPGGTVGNLVLCGLLVALALSH